MEVCLYAVPHGVGGDRQRRLIPKGAGLELHEIVGPIRQATGEDPLEEWKNELFQHYGSEDSLELIRLPGRVIEVRRDTDLVVFDG